MADMTSLAEYADGGTDVTDMYAPSDLGQTDEERRKDEAERELCERIDVMMEASEEQQRRILRSREVKAYRYWKGEQWLDRNKDRKKRGRQWAQSVDNRIFGVIEQQISLMTNRNPKGIFVPIGSDPGDDEFAKDWQTLVDWRARRLQMRVKLIRGLYYAKLCGWQAAYVFWDDDLVGQPDVNVMWLKPGELIVDPQLRDTNIEDGSYVGLKRQVSLDYVMQRWPEHAARLKQEVDTEGDRSDGNVLEVVEDTTSLDAELGHTPNVVNVAVEDRALDQVEQKVTLVSMWFKDRSVRTERVPVPFKVLQADGKVVENAAGQHVYADTGELFDPLSAPQEDVDVPAYPNGRYVVKVGSIILVDEPWQGLWPISLGNNIPLLFRWYGVDETDSMQQDQDTVNTMVSHVEDHTELCVHPRLKAETSAVVDPKSVKNTPDAVIWMHAGRINGLQWEQVPPLSGDVYRLYEMKIASIENNSAMSGVAMGRTPTSTRSATEIATLSQAGQGRIGKATAFFEAFIARLYKLMAECMQKYYDVNRIIRITGEDGQQRAVQITQKHKQVEYDVEVEVGSTMPYDRAARREDALTLNNQLQGAYLPEVLDAFEVRNKQEVLQRYQVWQQFMAVKDLLMIPEVQQYLAQVQASLQQQGNQPQTGGVQ